MSELIKIAALWQNESPKGTYYSGYLGDAKLMLFKNKFKEEGSKQPDLLLYVTAKPQKTEENKFRSDNDKFAAEHLANKSTTPTDPDIPF